MRCIAKLVVLAAAPLLTGALWMDDQPSYKAYEPPVLAPPAGSVPFSGKETAERLPPPVPPTAESLAQGKKLFDINCALCHGHTSALPGPVGTRLKPPPPGLDHELLKKRSDSHIIKVISSGFGRMPPFRDKLSSRDRQDLVNFLRTRK
ncbi:MAG TPA: cytochrome c [Geobacteraceae bacterium]